VHNPQAPKAMQTLLAVVLVVLAAAATAGDNRWARVREPHPGPPEVIGGYAAGCLAGASRLALQGTGYQVMRPGRNRFYGHPRLVAFVEALGRQAAERGWGRVLVGDMAQPRGGPTDYGHRSHQSGLDVDIWFRLLAQGAPPLSRAEAEDLPMLSVVQADRGRLDSARWSPRYTDLVRTAASAREVERVFVHPVIKRALCEARGDDRSWLAKVRPYWGHDAHFHVRLACPPDSPRCAPQDPVPPGDGCDADLDRWIEELRVAAAKPAPKAPPRPREPLPAACGGVLADARG
jgi:penicillin-insensitive murein endopeptidase